MKSSDANLAQFACVYIKKEFVTEDSGLSRDGFSQMSQQLFEFVDFNKSGAYMQSLGYLIVKVFAKVEQLEELLNKTVTWSQNENPLARSFAMYLIEVLADVHIPVELFNKYLTEFANIFSTNLNDPDIRVKVSALKATSSFLTSMQNKEDIKQFSPIIEPMLNTIIDALQQDESIG